MYFISEVLCKEYKGTDMDPGKRASYFSRRLWGKSIVVMRIESVDPNQCVYSLNK